MNDEMNNQLHALRQEAEARLQQKISEAENELRLYETELEIQHEELRRAYLELSDLYEEYWELFQYAPCGYITLNHNRIITRVNDKAAELLGVANSPVAYFGFSRLVCDADQSIFFTALKKAQDSKQTQTVALQLKAMNHAQIPVILNIQGSFALSGEVRQWKLTFTESGNPSQNQC